MIGVVFTPKKGKRKCESNTKKKRKRFTINTWATFKGWKGARRNIWQSVTHCSDCIKATHADVRSYDSSNSVHYHWRKTSPLQNRSRLHLVRRGEIFGGNDAEKEKKKKGKKKKRKHFYRGPTMSCNLYFTNTTSTSVCSPTNSWMQYTTLIYPVKNQACGDLRERSALGGRRLRFGSANLTVVGKREPRQWDSTFFFFSLTNSYIVKQQRQ